MAADPRTRRRTSFGNEPCATAEYLLPSYWDQRFETEEHYEWFKGFEDFRHLLLPHLARSDRILVLGCGNSSLTADLWREGYRDITSVDLSEVVIRRMCEGAAAAGMESLRWQVADMLALPFGDACFDAVLEKGTMDVLFTDSASPWEPGETVCERAHRMLAEAHRVLTATGVLLSITFAQPHFRRPFFLAPQYAWNMREAAFGETFHYYLYALRKGARGPTDVLPPAHSQAVVTQHGAISMTHEHMDEESYLLRIDV